VASATHAAARGADRRESERPPARALGVMGGVRL
jgi:hypothetical protein